MRSAYNCGTCKRLLGVECFYLQRDKRYGRDYPKTHRCKECDAVYVRERWKQKREAEGRVYETREALNERLAARKAARRAERLRLWQEQLAEQERRREQRATSPTLKCSSCGETRPRSDFHPSMLDTCKSCVSERDHEKFQRDRATLSDRYVKRQLTKWTGLKASDVPAALLEAKRVQLQIQRLVAPRGEAVRIAIRWLLAALTPGPVSAEALNRRADEAGISYQIKQRALRAMGAEYNQVRNEWAVSNNGEIE
jgi:hypothetical protein